MNQLRFKVAGIPGFEPGNGGIKSRCLTAWRYPNEILTNLNNGADGET